MNTQKLSNEKLSDREVKAFNAISNFISSLHEVYETNKPLALYNRLISKTSLRDILPIKKHVKVFNDYLLKHKSKFLSSTEKINLDRNLTINYNDRVFIDLPLFISRSNKQTLLVIKEHLLTIIAILHPEDKAPLENLEKIEENLNSKKPEIDEFLKNNLDTSTKEGAFVGNLMSTIKDTVLNSDEVDTSNPMSFLTNILGSGLPEQLLSTISNTTSEGGEGLNPSNLMNTMQGLVKNLTSNLDPAAKKELKNMTSSLLSMFDDTPSQNNTNTQSHEPKTLHVEETKTYTDEANHLNIKDTHIIEISELENNDAQVEDISLRAEELD